MQNPYISLPKVIDLEEKMLKFWKDNEVEKKLQEKMKKSSKRFSFFDGPPNANALIGLHTGRSLFYKDVMLRFKAMQGYAQRRQQGFDCQGLPAELQVQKQLGLKDNKAIEKYGVEKFVQECKKFVTNYIEEGEKTTKRLGNWIHWETTYRTMTDEYMEVEWQFLKDCHKKGLLYWGDYVVPWCPKCGTSLSTHEVSEVQGAYKKVPDPSLYFELKVKGKDEYLLVWTTTPWTLLANAAVAVNPKLQYVKAKSKGKTYYICKDCIDILEKPKVLEEIPGKKLEGIEYEPLYKSPGIFKVVFADFVTSGEGTGFVHTAPGHGPDDFLLGKKLDMPFFSVVDEEGLITYADKPFHAKYFKDANKVVLDDLKKRGVVYKVEEITHDYPHCWRCNNPLVFRASKEWFLKVPEMKDKMIKESKTVKWVPDWVGEKRFNEWLENARDWCMSRKKYWGTPLPFWVCNGKEKHITVVGSKKELQKLSGKNLSGVELHKPYVDNIVMDCPKCGSPAKRVPEVADTWLDSGLMPIATLPFYTNKDYFKQWYPCDYITEAVDQTRGWYYSLMFVGVTATGKTPYKSVLTCGLIWDDKGEKMSKSKGNCLWMNDLLAETGADLIRWYMYTVANPSESMNFSIDDLKKGAGFMTVFWNVGNLLEMYKPSQVPPKPQLQIEDKWLQSRMNSVVKKVAENLEKLELYHAAHAIMSFTVDDVSRFYVKLIRDRLKKGDAGAWKTLYDAYMCSTKMLAPFVPFVTEAVYQSIRNQKDPVSVHLCEWPKPAKADEKLEKNMDVVRQITEKSLALREEKKLRLRWPLKQLVVEHENVKDLEPLKKILCSTLNVKDAVFKEGKALKIKLDETPLIAEWKYHELTRAIQQLRKQHKLNVSDKIDLLWHTTDKDLKTFIEQNQDKFKEAVGAKTVQFSDKVKEKISFNVQNKKVDVTVSF